MRPFFWKTTLALWFAVWAGDSSQGIEPLSGLADLPPEVAKVFSETLVPNVVLCETTDLDGEGAKEVLLFSVSPLFPESGDSDSMTISFQSLLMVFGEERDAGGGFPYRLNARKSALSRTPNPSHVTLAEMGGGPPQEIVWLEGGPDPKGRYRRAVVYSYRGNQTPSLIEVARFENPSGWVRVHDLDRDAVSEAIAFSETGGTTLCPDLLLFLDNRWTSLQSEIRSLGFPDIAGFQSHLGLDPNGRVTRDLLIRFKSFRATGVVPDTPPPAEDSLGPIYE